MLVMHIIRPADTEWAPPIGLAPINGTLQIFVERRKLNAVPISDSYPILGMDKIIVSLRDVEILSTLDAKEATDK